MMSRFFGVVLPDQGVAGMVGSVPPTLDLETDLKELGTAAIGAHSLRGAISGSAFCTSPGLTLDLPPFSNFRLNVVRFNDVFILRLVLYRCG